MKSSKLGTAKGAPSKEVVAPKRKFGKRLLAAVKANSLPKTLPQILQDIWGESLPRIEGDPSWRESFMRLAKRVVPFARTSLQMEVGGIGTLAFKSRLIYSWRIATAAANRHWDVFFCPAHVAEMAFGNKRLSGLGALAAQLLQDVLQLGLNYKAIDVILEKEGVLESFNTMVKIVVDEALQDWDVWLYDHRGADISEFAWAKKMLRGTMWTYYHELGHLFLDHFARADKMGVKLLWEHNTWNISADLPINKDVPSDIKEEGGWVTEESVLKIVVDGLAVIGELEKHQVDRLVDEGFSWAEILAQLSPDLFEHWNEIVSIGVTERTYIELRELFKKAKEQAKKERAQQQQPSQSQRQQQEQQGMGSEQEVAAGGGEGPEGEQQGSPQQQEGQSSSSSQSSSSDSKEDTPQGGRRSELSSSAQEFVDRYLGGEDGDKEGPGQEHRPEGVGEEDVVADARDPRPKSSMEAEAARREAARDRARRRKGSSGVGSGTGTLSEVDREMERLMGVRISWKVILRNLISRSLQPGARLKRSRAKLSLEGRWNPDAVKAGHRLQGIDCLFAIDCSGSVGEDEISLVYPIIAQGVRGAGLSSLWMIPWDGEPHPPQRISLRGGSKEVMEKLPAGGGTDLKKAFDGVNDFLRQHPEIPLVIFASDGEVDSFSLSEVGPYIRKVRRIMLVWREQNVEFLQQMGVFDHVIFVDKFER